MLVLEGLRASGGPCLSSMVCVRVSTVGAIESREGISGPLGDGVREDFVDDIVTSELSLKGDVEAK